MTPANSQRNRTQPEQVGTLSTPFRALKLDCPNFEPILQAYNSEERYYHNLKHVAATIESLKRHRFDSPEAQIAMIYHDVVYDTRAADNEAKSAAWAERDLVKLGASAQTVREVTMAILATDHKSPLTQRTQAAVVDADLSILGADADTYWSYAKAIRLEYSWVPERDFVIGRTKFLSSLLARPHLYTTPEYRRAYSHTASENIRAEITHLESQLRDLPC